MHEKLPAQIAGQESKLQPHGDWLTVLIGLVSLAVLLRWKVSNPLLIAATAVIGLIAYPLLQPAWVMVK